MVCLAFCFLSVSRRQAFVGRANPTSRDGRTCDELGFRVVQLTVSCFDRTKDVWGSSEARLETFVFFSREGDCIIKYHLVWSFVAGWLGSTKDRFNRIVATGNEVLL